MKIFSFGGGVQSTAVLCLQADGIVNYDEFVFANVGNDSENPRTLEYIRDYARPFAETHGIKLVEVQKRNRAGGVRTLYSDALSSKSNILPCWFEQPLFANRHCTVFYKIRVINQYIKYHCNPLPAVVGIGISLDEFQRASDSREPEITIKDYPLLDMRLSRSDCRKIIVNHGLPIPPKSSCYFCPFHKQIDWQRLLRDEPELFARAVVLDNNIRAKRIEQGKDGVYLHFSRHPLEKAVGLQYEMKFEDDLPCDTGYCFL